MKRTLFLIFLLFNLYSYSRDSLIVIKSENINSPQDDAFPFVLDKENIIFTTNRNGTEAIFLYNKGENRSKKIIYGRDNYSCVGMSPNREFFLIFSDEINNGDISIAKIGNKKVLEIIDILGPSVNTEEFTENSGWISNTGDTIIFTSNRNGGLDAFDFWMSVKLDDSWTTPVLFDLLNSTEEEKGLFIYDTILFFGSKGFNSMGGYDIFYCIKEDGSWSEPISLQVINTNQHELFYGIEGYFCSNREGDYDIYKLDTIEIDKSIKQDTIQEITEQDTIVADSVLLAEIIEQDTSIDIFKTDTITEILKKEDTIPEISDEPAIIHDKPEEAMKTGISEQENNEKLKAICEYYYVQIIALSPDNYRTNIEIINDICKRNALGFNYKLKRERHNNLNKYLINKKFYNLDEAIRFMQEIKKYYDINDIFVVGYSCDKRVAIFRNLSKIIYY